MAEDDDTTTGKDAAGTQEAPHDAAPESTATTKATTTDVVEEDADSSAAESTRADAIENGAAAAATNGAPSASTPHGEGESDSSSDEGGTPVKKRRRRWPWITAAAVVLLGGAYVGAAYYFAERIPAGTKVVGVDVSGMTRSEAAAALEEPLREKLDNPIQVTVAGESYTVDPASYSLDLDEEGTLDSLVGFSLDPRRLWAHIAGGRNVKPVLTVDEAELSSVVDDLAEKTDTEAVNADIVFDGTTPSVKPSEQGIALEREAAREVFSTDALTATQPINLEVSTIDPVIDDEKAQKALTELAEPLVADKLSVTVQEKLVELTPEQLAAAASFTENDGELALVLDSEQLGDIVRETVPDILTPGTDARIEIVNHTTPTITPSENGVGIDDEQLAVDAVEAVVSGNRTVEAPTKEVEAEFSTADAEALGVTEVVSQIETPLTDDAVRTTNLEVGTAKITNTLVMPGETFSLLDALGPIDAEHGFVSSGVVADGFNSTAMGGGLSQLSTNTFNIGYLAGFTDVEHKPHSKYFSRYPMGREATLWEGQIDMKWTNNTPYGAVIDTWVADGQVHSQLWSTKYWDVTTSTSDPYAYVAPSTSYNPAADCVPSGAGGSGFTVTVSRTVAREGTVEEESSYAWTYAPVDAVVCSPTG
ncbi:MAG: hypothetical protein E7Z96_00265 [Actinomycetaceae bacterium]|nr:hypothetical protein [Actinomycetaceae bacterium]